MNGFMGARVISGQGSKIAEERWWSQTRECNGIESTSFWVELGQMYITLFEGFTTKENYQPFRVLEHSKGDWKSQNDLNAFSKKKHIKEKFFKSLKWIEKMFKENPLKWLEWVTSASMS